MKAGSQIITERDQPRIPRLRTVLYVPRIIASGQTSTHKYQLAHFFDLVITANHGLYGSDGPFLA
jgi:hypothetical protein